ncbi:MAG: hypothetical protein HKN67_09525 [Saprospiraceae bacterium]|nr:hypothetical protein [Saprospiraceae bacterium]
MVYNLILCFSFLVFSCFNVQVIEPHEVKSILPEVEDVSVTENNGLEEIDYFDKNEIDKILYRINSLRKKGCRCDGKFYKPVRQLKWNRMLYVSAYKHAKSMHDNDYFSHYSPEGKDIGERLDLLGYKWQYAGENLAEGQKSFDEAMHDWIASPTHCIMLMNPNMEEVAVAKYGSYWVQHFGKQMPKNARRINERYTDGSK